MVYKKKDTKINKIYYRKIIFSIILLIYFSGLCAGCAFAFKNRDNFDFVQKVTNIRNHTEIQTTGNFAASGEYLIRDISSLVIMLLFKYSGVLKGMCICIPFIIAVQNTCIYSVLIYQHKIGIFSILIQYILKDTAVSFLLIIYLFTILNDIIIRRQDIKKDMKKVLVYSLGILLVYIIDFTVKSIILPLQ